MARACSRIRQLARYVNDRRITLEICLTSNVQTRAVRGYDAHPLRAYFDHGMQRGAQYRQSPDQWHNTHGRIPARRSESGLHPDELGEIALESFASAFLPWETRRHAPRRGEARDRRAHDRALSKDHLLSSVDEQSADAVTVTADFLRERLGDRAPRLAIVLGSGMGSVVRDFEDSRTVAYAEIPRFPAALVRGHTGEVVAGLLEGVAVLAFAGRFHLYEGHSSAVAALPVRVAHALGARVLLVSNAAGGIRRSFRPGDLMIIRDQINLMWRSPLTGPARAGRASLPRHVHPYDSARGAAA